MAGAIGATLSARLASKLFDSVRNAVTDHNSSSLLADLREANGQYISHLSLFIVEQDRVIEHPRS